MIITTEWKNPQSVYQDARYNQVSEGICYPMYDLGNIKKGDNSFAYQTQYIRGEYVGGTHKHRPSPMIYAYNYNFNIPLKATIVSVELEQIVTQGSYAERLNLTTRMLKLKTTDSTTDAGGVNRNLAKNVVFAAKPQWTTIQTTVTAEQAMIKLTPELINRPSFGQVFQAIGIMEGKVDGYGAERGWDDLQISHMRMRVTYDVPEIEDNEANKQPTFRITAGIKKTQKEKLSLDYPKQKTFLDITYERLPENGKYYGGTTPQLYIKSDNNIYLFSEKKQTQYMPQTIPIKTTDKKPALLTSSIEVYPNWADLEGTIIIEWEENGKIKHKYVSLPVAPWSELPSSFNESDTSQGCIIANNTFDSCWSGEGGGYYIERCYDEILMEYEEGKTLNEERITDAYGYLCMPNPAETMEGTAGTNIPNTKTGSAVFTTYQPFNVDEVTFGTRSQNLSEYFTVKYVKPQITKKAKKNYEGNYIVLDTTNTHEKTINITDTVEYAILHDEEYGEGAVRLEFSKPIDVTSARIKVQYTREVNGQSEDVEEYIDHRFQLSDYDYDTTKKNTPYYIIAKYNFYDYGVDEWNRPTKTVNMPNTIFTLIYYEYKQVNKYYPVTYDVHVDFDFGDDRSNYGDFFIMYFTPYIRVQKPVICTTNNNHKNVLNVAENPWCIEPAGYVKEKCLSPSTLKVVPTLTFTLDKNTVVWTESVTATIQVSYKNIPIQTDETIEITDNKNRLVATVNLENGKATTKIKPLDTATTKLIATWGETNRYKSTTAEQNITVNKLPPTLTLTADKSTLEYNQKCTFTAHLYYTDRTTEKQVNLSTNITLSQNTTTLTTSKSNSKGILTYTQLLTTAPGTHTFKVEYPGTANIAAKTTTKSITETKGTIQIKLLANQSTKSAQASTKEALQLYMQLYDANTKQEIKQAPAPFTFISNDTGGTDPIVTSGRNTTSTSPFTAIGNSGEQFHGEVLADGTRVGYDDRAKNYYVRIISHPYYDKSVDKQYDDAGNDKGWMVSNTIPIQLLELETRIKTIQFFNENNKLLSTVNNEITIPEKVTAKGVLQFKLPTGTTIGSDCSATRDGTTQWYNLNERIYMDTNKVWHDAEPLPTRPANSVHLDILHNNVLKGYHEFPAINGAFEYTWEAWRDTNETTSTHSNQIQVRYLNQQSGIYKGATSDKVTLTVRKAQVSIKTFNPSKVDGKVRVTGKVVWIDSEGEERTDWDNYTDYYIKPFLANVDQRTTFTVNNNGTFDYSFVPRQKNGTFAVTLGLRSTNTFYSYTTSAKNVTL